MKQKNKQDTIILPADKPKQLKLGWTVKEYLGSQCCSLSDLDKPIINDELKVNDEIIVWNSLVARVSEINGDRGVAIIDSSGYYILLSNDIDDRNCWVATAMINPKCIKKLVGK